MNILQKWTEKKRYDTIYGEDYYFQYCLNIIPNIKPKN